MSDELSNRPVGDDDPTEHVRGRRIAESEADDPEPGAPLNAPALPSRVAEAIFESEHDPSPPAPPPAPRSHSRRAAWAENRASRVAAREAARRHAQDEAAEAARAKAMEDEQALLAARHAAAERELREQTAEDRPTISSHVEDGAAETEAARRAVAAEAARRAAEAEEVRRQALEVPPREEPVIEEPVIEEPALEEPATPAVSEGEDYARRWAEAEESILRAQEQQRIRAERAVAARAAAPVEQDSETVIEEQVAPEPVPEPVPEPAPELATEDEPADSARRVAERPERRRKDASSLNSLRSKFASLVWLVAVLAALVLAVGALVVALELNPDNTIVQAIRDAAAAIDFGVFREFAGEDAATRSALVNWGIAAVIWLVVGKVLDKLIRP